MKYLVTFEVSDGEDVTRLVDFDELSRIFAESLDPQYGYLNMGEAILIRRADYMDTALDTAPGRAYGHLRVIK